MSRKRQRSTRPILLVSIAGTALLALATGCTSYTEPAWSSVAKVEGTNYVTDGNLAIDMRLVEAEPPPTQSSSKWFSDSLFANRRSETPEQFGLDDIHASASDPAIVVGPGELQLVEPYIAYLTGKLASDHAVAFWQLSAKDPVVIVVDGNPVGAMKALN